MRHFAARLAAATPRGRAAFPHIAVASLMLAIAPAQAQDNGGETVQPDGTVVEQPLDPNQAATGAAEGEQPVVDPAVAEGEPPQDGTQGGEAAEAVVETPTEGAAAEATAGDVVDEQVIEPTAETGNAEAETTAAEPTIDAAAEGGETIGGDELPADSLGEAEATAAETPAEPVDAAADAELQPAADGEAATTAEGELPADANASATSADALLPAEDGEAATAAEGEQLPSADAAATSADSELLPLEDGQAATAADGELLPADAPAATAAEGELLPADDQAATGDELLPPADGQAATAAEEELLPADDQAATGDELLPAADGEAASSDELLAATATTDDENAGLEVETVTVDPSSPQQDVAVPDGMVRVIVQNVSSAPMDLFIDAGDGSDPTWVLTLSPGFQIVQPSHVGQAWRVAQNDAWMGGFVPGDEPMQILKFNGGRL